MFTKVSIETLTVESLLEANRCLHLLAKNLIEIDVSEEWVTAYLLCIVCGA